MKIELINTFHNKQITIYPRNSEEIIFSSKMIKISRSTYKKIENLLCGSTDCECGITFGDKNYKLFVYHYNYKGHNDESEFYIEVLKNNE